MTKVSRLCTKNTGNRQSERMCTVPESWPVAVSETWVQPGQGPLNAGSNSDSLKVTSVALTKSDYMLGNLSDVTLLRSECKWLKRKKNQIEVKMR